MMYKQGADNPRRYWVTNEHIVHDTQYNIAFPQPCITGHHPNHTTNFLIDHESLQYSYSFGVVEEW